MIPVFWAIFPLFYWIFNFPGKPTVIANCHPVKNASSDNLVPAGGGNFLNQVDGNLTAAKTDSTTELHWQGKFRGVDFAPMYFLIKTVTHERLKDSNGRKIPTVISQWISEKVTEEMAAQAVGDQIRMLDLISKNPKASLSKLAELMKWKMHNGDPNKVKAQRCVKKLKGAALIEENHNGGHRLTSKGGKAVLEGKE